MKSTSVAALLTFSSITALAQDWSKNVSASAQCMALNQIALTQAANGHVVEAETSLALATAAGDDRAETPVSDAF